MLKARAADMAGGEEMDCGMGELRRALALRLRCRPEILLCQGLNPIKSSTGHTNTMPASHESADAKCKPMWV